MAEPLGLTGTAAGLVSLGLQLHGEISKYIGAVKGRKRELDAAKRSADTLQKCLTAIDGIISPVAASSTAREAFETCRLSCEDEINALKALVERLRGPLTPADTLSAKLRERSRKLTYPFHRNDVLELEKRLESVNNGLQTALHTLELSISRDIQDLATTLNSDVQAVRLRTDSSGATLARVANTVENSSDRLEKLIPEIHTQTTRTSIMVSQQAQTLSQTTRVSVRLEETAQQTQKRFDRTDEVLTQFMKGQQEINQQMLQLIARPSHLRSLCDQFPMESPADFTRPTDLGSFESRRADLNYRRCPCTKRRKLQRNKRTFGPLFLETEFSETTHHASDCRLSRIAPSEQQQKRGFGITIPALQSILNQAVRVSMSLNTGAGGLSFSQGLSWVATVDSQRSPAFRLMKLALTALSCDGVRLTQEQSFQVTESCVNRLAWCYEQKISSPADMNHLGQTLVAVGVLEIPILGSQQPVFVHFVRRLLELNVPVNTSTGRYYGEEPILSHIIKHCYIINPESGHELSRALAMSGAESDRLRIEEINPICTLNAFRMLKEFPNYAEMLNVGSLMMTILRQDLPAMRDLLKKFPSVVWEKDNDGLTAVHAAVLVGNKRILELVLSSSNADLVNTVDSLHHYPIDYAFRKSFHKACEIYNDENCSGCETVEALLQSGSALSASSLRSELGIRDRGEVNHSKAVRRIALKHLKDRRCELQDLATNKLHKSDRRRLGIPTSRVLDRQAMQAQQLLEATLGQISPEIVVVDRHEDLDRFESRETVVYAHTWDRKTAQYAWDLGFHDIGPNAVDGFYQIANYGNVNMDLKLGRCVVAYTSWLVGHGLELKAVVEDDARDSKPTNAHYLMVFLGRNRGFGSDERLTMSPEVSGAVFSESVKDRCLCGCSFGGCSPLTKFLRQAEAFFIGRTKNSDGLERPWEISRIILGMIPRKERLRDQYSWIYRGILRYLTFAALDLRHTCCDEWLRRRSSYRWKMDDENVEEIREEEKDGLLLLETLVAEFEARCGCNSRLAGFLQEYWEPRMQQVKRDIDRRKLTEFEIQTAEKLGVVWHSDEDSVVSNDDLDFEDAMKRMDDIAPDPRRRP